MQKENSKLCLRYYNIFVQTKQTACLSLIYILTTMSYVRNIKIDEAFGARESQNTSFTKLNLYVIRYHYGNWLEIPFLKILLSLFI